MTFSELKRGVGWWVKHQNSSLSFGAILAWSDSEIGPCMLRSRFINYLFTSVFNTFPGTQQKFVILVSIAVAVAFDVAVAVANLKISRRTSQH